MPIVFPTEIQGIEAVITGPRVGTSITEPRTSAEKSAKIGTAIRFPSCSANLRFLIIILQRLGIIDGMSEALQANSDGGLSPGGYPTAPLPQVPPSPAAASPQPRRPGRRQRGSAPECPRPRMRTGRPGRGPGASRGLRRRAGPPGRRGRSSGASGARPAGGARRPRTAGCGARRRARRIRGGRRRGGGGRGEAGAGAAAAAAVRADGVVGAESEAPKDGVAGVDDGCEHSLKGQTVS